LLLPRVFTLLTCLSILSLLLVQIWYDNVPHPALASYKADQNWVKAEGQKFVFPGGGTQFKYGATKYIEWLQDVSNAVRFVMITVAGSLQMHRLSAVSSPAVS